MKPRTWNILSIFPNFGNSVAGLASLANIALLLYFVLKQAFQDTTYTDFKVTPDRSADIGNFTWISNFVIFHQFFDTKHFFSCEQRM